MTDTRPRTSRRDHDDDRLLPASLDDEAAVLGACLMSREAVERVAGRLLSVDFYKPAHAEIWDAMVELFTGGTGIDTITLANVLRRRGMFDQVGGASYLLELQATTPAISNAGRYAENVMRDAQLRTIIRAGAAISNLGYEEDDPGQAFDRAQTVLHGAREMLARSGNEVYTPWITDLTAQPWAPPRWVFPGMLEEARRLILVGKKKSGKALEVGTSIPTPDGFRPIGALAPGDLVFGRDGSPTRVVAVTTPQERRPSFTVRFRTGAELVADREHEWTIRRAHPNAPEDLTVNTADLRVGDRVPMGGPAQRPDVPLPIDPYVLGAWLGDGHSADARITQHADDAEVLTAEFKRRGYSLTPGARDGDTVVMRIGSLAFDDAREEAHRLRQEHPDASARAIGRATGLSKDAAQAAVGPGRRNAQLGNVPPLLRPVVHLRSLGVLGDKHVPDVYLTAGTGQRMALLQGLMDTDGHVAPNGHAEFCTTSPRIADGFAQLAASLGIKVVPRESDAVLNGRVVGRRWRFTFTPSDEGYGWPVTFPRKLAPLLTGADGRANGTRSRTRTRWVPVDAITPAGPRTTCCIQVEAADGLYQAGPLHTVTHNSTVARQMLVYGAAGWHPFQSRGQGATTRLAPLVDANGDRRFVKSLVVDYENRDDDWRKACRPMVDWLRTRTPELDGQPFPMGVFAAGSHGGRYDPVDSRADEADLFARLDSIRPDVVFFGAMYKLDQGDDKWTMRAGKIQRLIDRIQGAFGCAVLMEMHTTGGGGGRDGKSDREAREPRGAADWGFWTDLMYSLTESADDGMVRRLHPLAVRDRDLYRYFPRSLQWTGTPWMPYRAEWPATVEVGDGGPLAYDRPPDWNTPGQGDLLENEEEPAPPLPDDPGDF